MSESPTHTIPCPHCGVPLQIPAAAAGHPIVCPHCFNSFFLALPGASPIENTVPSSDAGEPEPPGDSSVPNIIDDEDDLPDLDANRIKQHVSLLRSLFRYRSYCIVTASLCLGAIIGIIWIVEGWHGQNHTLALTLYCTIPFLLYGALYFTRRSFHFARMAEEAKHRDDPNLPPPDFSKLSDGSQIYKQLENVRDDRKRK